MSQIPACGGSAQSAQEPGSADRDRYEDEPIDPDELAHINSSGPFDADRPPAVIIREHSDGSASIKVRDGKWTSVSQMTTEDRAF
ncbi:MAG: hypothetical protein AAGC55_10080, partial [Myxococcota bacterium]